MSLLLKGYLLGQVFLIINSKEIMVLPQATDNNPQRNHSERGITMIEVLVSIVLTAIASLGITSSLRVSMHVAKLTEVHQAASSIAGSRMEALSAIDFIELDSSYNESNVIVTVPGLAINFQRSTTISINPDQSRRVEITVNSTNALLPSAVNFTSTFALWE